MAYNNGYRGYGNKRTYSKRTRSNSNTYTEAEKLAYNLGRIQRGINNPNSKVYESYRNGVNGVTTRQNQKPLF